MEIFFLLIALIIFGSISLFWFLSTLMLSPKSSLLISKDLIKTDWNTSYEKLIEQLPESTDFNVSSFDGVNLEGKYFKFSQSTNAVIIGAHGWNGTWIEMLKYLPALEDHSYDLVLFDHRGHGGSDKVYPTGGINEAKDLLAITEWVRNTTGVSNEQIGWLGSSWGGSAALIAGATKINIGFIIADSPFQDWYSAIFERAERDYGSWTKHVSSILMKIVDFRTGVSHKEASPLLAAKHVESPVLLIHSQMDGSTDSQQSVNISKNLNTQSEFHHLNWGGGHTLDVVIHKDRFRKIVTDFLKNIDKCNS